MIYLNRDNWLRKALVLASIMLFVGAGIIPSMGGTVVEKTSSTVLGSPGYIQDLINNANDGDTINIPSGTYYENIVVDKSINLIGEDRDTTVIYGNGSGNVIHISSNKVKISGFTIQNSGDVWYNAGVFVHSNSNIIQGNNIVWNNGDGIHLSKSRFNIIKDNTISNNRSGIYVYGSKFNFIKGNNISNNRVGIFIDSSSYSRSWFNFILKNNFIDNEEDAYFNGDLTEILFFRTNRWRQNYWNGTQQFPKSISVELCYYIWTGFGGAPVPISWFPQMDWLPAKEPYDV